MAGLVSVLLRSDLAGEVVFVGPDVVRFKVGDPVLGTATGKKKVGNRAAESAFQIQTVVMAHMASPIPDTWSWAAATALPVALPTAALGAGPPVDAPGGPEKVRADLGRVH
jgi:NADPH:quinone reductase-like Zn-dependent oxidoreductase